MKESCGRHDAVRCYDMTVSSRTEHTQHPAYDRKQRAGVRVPFACLTLKLVIQVLVPSFWTSQIALQVFFPASYSEKEREYVVQVNIC